MATLTQTVFVSYRFRLITQRGEPWILVRIKVNGSRRGERVLLPATEATINRLENLFATTSIETTSIPTA